MSVRFLLLVVVFVGCSDTSPLQSFDDVFEKVAEVPLDAQVLLGGVTAMDVDESGRIVIADMNSGSTHLFEKNGTLIRSFAATECNPGEESRPFRVRFVSRDRFVVSTLNRTTYEFSATEGCRWKVDAMTPAPRSTCRTDTDNVFGFFYERPQARVVRYNPDLSPIDTLSLAVTDFPRLNTTFNISQYLACSAGDAMYIYAESSAPRYVEQPEALAWEPPGFFRQITDEVEHSPKGVDGFQEGRRQSFASGTYASMVLAFDATSFVTAYSYTNMIDRVYQRFYHVVVEDARMEIEVDNSSPWIAAGRDGFIYTIVLPGRQDSQPDLELADHENPVILKYRLRG